ARGPPAPTHALGCSFSREHCYPHNPGRTDRCAGLGRIWLLGSWLRPDWVEPLFRGLRLDSLPLATRPTCRLLVREGSPAIRRACDWVHGHELLLPQPRQPPNWPVMGQRAARILREGLSTSPSAIGLDPGAFEFGRHPGVEPPEWVAHAIPRGLPPAAGG